MRDHSRFWDELAIKSYKTILKQNPHIAIVHNNMGLAYLRLGRPKKAIRAFEKAIKCDRTLTEAHYHLGTTYQNLGDDKAAIRCFKNYTKLKTEKKPEESIVEDLLRKLKN